MHRPHHGGVNPRQVVEQYAVVQEIAVDVMDVDDVGPYRLYPPDEPSGGAGRCQSVAVGQTGRDAVPCHAPPVAHGYGVRLAGEDFVTPVAVGDVALPAVLHGKLAYLLHDAPGGGVGPQHGVDLKQLSHFSVSEVKRLSHRAMTASSE